MKYVVLAIASDAEAQRLVEDLTEHAGEPLRTPRWGNAVHAALITSPPGAEHVPLPLSRTGLSHECAPRNEPPRTDAPSDRRAARHAGLPRASRRAVVARGSVT